MSDTIIHKLLPSTRHRFLVFSVQNPIPLTTASKYQRDMQTIVLLHHVIYVLYNSVLCYSILYFTERHSYYCCVTKPMQQI